MSEQLYVVRFRGRGRDRLTDWSPAEGVPYECSRQEAEERFAFLEVAGDSRAKIDGVVPWFVAIYPAESKGDADALVLKSVYIDDEHSSAVGPWTIDFEPSGHPVAA